MIIKKFKTAMSRLPFVPSVIIEGGANGGDRLGRQWAIENSVHYATVPALWDIFGKSAGYKRNEAMLNLQPSYCIALPGGKGTAMMVNLCRKGKIPCWLPYGE